MSDRQNELPEDDDEWFPPPHRSRRWRVIIGALVFIALIAIGSTVALHALTKASVVPIPTTVNYGPPVPTPWVMPGLYCDQAVQKIEQNQIAYILIYREKDGGPAIPKNAVMGIEILPRGIPYQGDPAQSVQNSLLQIYGNYPFNTCYSPVLAAVKQANKHLSGKEQVKVGWYYDLSG